MNRNTSLTCRYVGDMNWECGTGGLSVLVPTDVGHIEYNIEHTVNARRHVDTWRISQAFWVRNGERIPITVAGGEWDMALRLTGRPDFIGGWAHGDEICTAVECRLDGVKWDPCVLKSTITCEKIDFLVRSVGYDPSEPSQEVLLHEKIITVTWAGMHIKQRVTWLGDYSLGGCYLAMMPPMKQYTDTYFTNENPTPTAIPNLLNLKIPGPTAVTVYGRESGLYFHMEIDKYKAPYENSGLLELSDNGGVLYNKMYFAYCTPGDENTVTKGTVWETVTRYHIEAKG